MATNKLTKGIVRQMLSSGPQTYAPGTQVDICPERPDVVGRLPVHAHHL
ncbi:MAG: hypothetical protein JO031_16710 [Ktedonobacteraceae bacterium]|nr:hypothetical protein [Ktedonobacteraceae bacterium]